MNNRPDRHLPARLGLVTMGDCRRIHTRRAARYPESIRTKDAPLTALGVSPTWVTSLTPVCANQISVCVDGNQRGQTMSSSFSGSPWSHSLCTTSMSSAQAQLLLDAGVVPHLVQLLDPSSAFTTDKLESAGNFSHSNHHHWHVQLALL